MDRMYRQTPPQKTAKKLCSSWGQGEVAIRTFCDECERDSEQGGLRGRLPSILGIPYLTAEVGLEFLLRTWRCFKRTVYAPSPNFSAYASSAMNETILQTSIIVFIRRVKANDVRDAVN